MKKRKPIRRAEVLTLTGVAQFAENNGIYNVESERRGILYCYNDGEYAIITSSKGVLRMNPDEVETILTELAGIKDDVDRLVRAGRR